MEEEKQLSKIMIPYLKYVISHISLQLERIESPDLVTTTRMETNELG